MDELNSSTASVAALYVGRHGRLPAISSAETAILAVIFTILISVALSGNLLVCLAIVFDRKLRKQENMFLASLAASDVLMAMAVMTFAAVNDIKRRWIFGGEYCIIWMSSDVMCSTASILNLAAISFDRYWHIRAPLLYMETMTRRKIFAIIAVIWILSASISFIPFTLGLHLSSPDPGTRNSTIPSGDQFSNPLIQTLPPISAANNTSVPDYQRLAASECIMDLNPTYAVMSSTISFFLPCTIMIIAYSRLYFFARYHVRILKDQYKSLGAMLLVTVPGMPQAQKNRLTPTTMTPKDGSDSQLVGNKRQTSATCGSDPGHGLSDHKARVTVGIIVGVFLVCWLPFFSINILQALCSCIPTWLFKTVTWIGYANSTANPIIYSIFSRDFRNAFKRILKCQRELVRFMSMTNLNNVNLNNSGGTNKHHHPANGMGGNEHQCTGRLSGNITPTSTTLKVLQKTKRGHLSRSLMNILHGNDPPYHQTPSSAGIRRISATVHNSNVSLNVHSAGYSVVPKECYSYSSTEAKNQDLTSHASDSHSMSCKGYEPCYV